MTYHLIYQISFRPPHLPNQAISPIDSEQQANSLDLDIQLQPSYKETWHSLFLQGVGDFTSWLSDTDHCLFMQAPLWKHACHITNLCAISNHTFKGMRSAVTYRPPLPILYDTVVGARYSYTMPIYLFPEPSWQVPLKLLWKSFPLEVLPESFSSSKAFLSKHPKCPQPFGRLNSLLEVTRRTQSITQVQARSTLPCLSFTLPHLGLPLPCLGLI